MSRPQLSETSHREKVYPVSPEWARGAWVDEPKYRLGTTSHLLSRRPFGPSMAAVLIGSDHLPR